MSGSLVGMGVALVTGSVSDVGAGQLQVRIPQAAHHAFIYLLAYRATNCKSLVLPERNRRELMGRPSQNEGSLKKRPALFKSLESP